MRKQITNGLKQKCPKGFTLVAGRVPFLVAVRRRFLLLVAVQGSSPGG